MVGTFIFSLQNVQGSYYWEIFLQLTESPMDNWDLKIFSIALSFMKIGNCWHLHYFSWKKKKKCNLSVILWKLLKLEDFSIKKSIAPEFVTVKVSQDLKLSAQWNRRLSRCMSKIIECLEQNIRNKIDCKRPSNIKHMNRLQNTGI